MTEAAKRLRVLIIRHGETRENVERIIQGQLDTDLNEKGRLQARLTGEYLSSTRIDRIISSPLRRAADTAKAIVDGQSSRKIHLEFDDRLKERGFGVLEGKVYVGAAKKSEETQGIELMEPFSERLGSFWNDLVTREAQQLESEHWTDNTETVVLVSHGAAISALMNQVLIPGRYCIVPPSVIPSRFWNCSITELVVPVISIASPEARSKAGDIARKTQWSIRPIHLGVQGSQFLLDHELQKRLLAHTLQQTGAAHKSKAAQELEEMILRTTAEFERDPAGRKQLEQDSIQGPDGMTVEADIGYGKAIGMLLQWSNIDHLQHIDHEVTVETSSNSKSKATVNVDELVK